MEDQWDYWRQALAGNQPQIHEGEPKTGFYRKRNKPYNGKPQADQPVAIWAGDDGNMIALIGPQDRAESVDPASIWTWVADKPVSYEDYQAAHEKNAWDKAIEGLEPLRGAGDNNPPEDVFAELSEQLDAVQKLADEALSKDTLTDDDSDRLVNIKDRMIELYKAAEAERKAEKKVHDEAGKAVQKKWKPLLEGADSAKKKLLARITDFLKRKQQAEAKAAYLAAKEAEAKGEDIPVLQTRRAQSGGAVSGRKTSLRTRKFGVIDDPLAFAVWLVENKNPDMLQTLETCANRIAASGADAPGVTVKKEQVAA